MNELDQIKQIANALLQEPQSGSAHAYDLIAIKDGRNNRVYKLVVDNRSYLLKQYFFSKDDPRDRLGTEFSFSLFAWRNGLRQIPKPYCCDREANFALFAFIDGKKLKKGEVKKGHIDQTLEFIEQLNKNIEKKDALKLSLASEACFSFKNHILSVDNRIKQLNRIDINDDVDRQVMIFFEQELAPSAKEIKKNILSEIEGKKKVLKQIFSVEKRILSPSDFGFHNALITDENRLHFFDFEYAGWDDPVKLICDFFCQPDIPVPINYLEWFVKSLSEYLVENSSTENMIWCVNLLLPLYRIKWCCIIINAFLRIDAQRKKFASFNDDKRLEQLQKVLKYAQEHNICK